MDGNIEVFNSKLIRGWIRTEYGEDLFIDVHVDDQPIAMAHPVDLIRNDVEEAGLGHRRCGFLVPMPATSAGSGEVEITIRASEGQQILLARRAAPTMLPPDVEPDAPKPQFVCHVDSLTPDLFRGWSVDATNPDHVFDIDLFVDGHFFVTVRNDQGRRDLQDKGLSNGLGGILVELPLAWLEDGEHAVLLRLPDETTMESHVFVRQKKRALNPALIARPLRRLSVVVPIYDAADDVEVCIRRLIAHTPAEIDILFIDDASPDPRIAELLHFAAQEPNMRIAHNSTNMGFTRTINRGLAETGDNDVIILNSDARVTPGWAEGMMMAAGSGPRIATVTAMSDRAGAFSAPRLGNDNPLPEGVDEITYARAFRRHSMGLYPSVPTGNGFCMLISRACLDEIGRFDAASFPRGYGEENDFCMRAGRAGWRNIIDDRTYVFHARSKSFGDAKAELMEAGRIVVDGRYPEYRKAIRVFSSGDRIGVARLRGHQAAAAARAEPDMPCRVLFVISTQTGGTPQTNRDLMIGLGDAVDGWILRCDSKSMELSQMLDGEVRLRRSHLLEEPVDPISHGSMEYDAVVSEWLLGLDPDIVHIRHLAWHGLSLPRIASDLGKKVVFSFHDFYALCPTVKLLDENSLFCGGTCTASGGDCRPELWPDGSLPELKHKWVHVWRDRFAKALERCDAFITTSVSARQLIFRAMPSLPAGRFLVIPHGRDFPRFHRLRQAPVHGEPLRILVPGNINAAKGLNVIHALLEHDKAGLLEFHVMGNIGRGNQPPHPRLIHLGAYAREDFAAKAAPIGAHLAAVFSVWDETYCHTLTETWSVGLPAIVFDFPTVATRVRQTGAGWVMDHRNIAALYERILHVAFDDAEQRRTDEAVAAWQVGDGIGHSTRLMAADYLAVYRDVLRAPGITPGTGTKARVAVVCPAGSALDPSTHARVRERTRNTIGRDITYIPMSPASLLACLREGKVDAAIIQRAAIHRTLAPQVMKAFEDTAIPYVLELDEDLLNIPAEQDPDDVHADYACHLGGLISGAAHVMVSTPSLATLVAGHNEKIVILPDLPSKRLWGTHVDKPQPGGHHAVYVATKTLADDLAMIMPALDEVAARYPLFQMTVIGVTPELAFRSDRGNWLGHLIVPEEAQPYDKFVAWLRQQAVPFDFGIAPLKHSLFDAGKSALAILDHAALGLPVLASDVDAYRETGGNAPSVRLVPNTVADWTEALSQQIALGAENHENGVESRQRAGEADMLDHTLPAFDALILSSIRHAAPIASIVPEARAAAM